VGFISTSDGWEYPLWALPRPSGLGPFILEHVAVGNASRTQRGLPGFEPCAVFSLDPGVNSTGSLDVNGTTYRPIWTQADVVAILTVDGR
jgi:hypothetical protein